MQARGARDYFFTLLRFCCVGAVNTLFALFFYWLASDVISPVWAYGLAYALGLVTSYAANKAWTFREKIAIDYGQQVKFVVVNIVALVCSSITVYLVHDICGQGRYLAFFVAVLVSLFFNFSGNFFWTFRNRN